jgi:hypothetical protein
LEIKEYGVIKELQKNYFSHYSLSLHSKGYRVRRELHKNSIRKIYSLSLHINEYEVALSLQRKISCNTG